MNKVLIFILISFSISKDLILVGDSRVREIANVLLEVEDRAYYENIRVSIQQYYSPITTDPVPYEDFNIQVTTTQLIKHLVSGSDAVNLLHNQLKSAKPGTNVLLNIGIDDLDLLDSIIIFYGKLADKYIKLNFYVVSVIGVDETKINIENSKVIEFNKIIQNRILEVEFSNLKYKDILYNEDPTKIVLDGKPVDLFKYSTDGKGFFRTGLTKIFQAFVEGLKFES